MGACLVYLVTVVPQVILWLLCHPNCECLEPGLGACHLRRVLRRRLRRKQRRRKPRPKAQWSPKLIAFSAFRLRGHRYCGRKRRSHMGFWCGPRAGSLGLFVPQVQATATQIASAPPGVCSSRRLRAALARDLQVSDQGLCSLRDRTQEPRTVEKTRLRAKRNRAGSDQDMTKSQTTDAEAVSPKSQEAKAEAVCPPRVCDLSSSELPGFSAKPPRASHGDGCQPAMLTKVIEGILPWDWVKTSDGWQQWGGFCSGGGGGNSELLEGLQALLAKVQPGNNTDGKQPKGKGKKSSGTDGGPPTTSSATPTSDGSVRGKGKGNSITSDSDLFKALEGVVRAAKKDPSDLLSALQDVVHRAVVGYGHGRAARRLRAKEQGKAEAAQPSPAPAPQTRVVEPSFCRPVAHDEQGGSEWKVVESKKKQGAAAVQQWTVDPLVGGLLGFGIAKKRLTDGVPLGGHLVIANEQAELDAILSLARAHELKDAMSVICRFVPAGDATTMQLPSVGPRGQKQVRSWPAVALTEAGGPTIKNKAVIKATFAAPDRKLVTVRVQVPKADKAGIGPTAFLWHVAETSGR